MKKFYLVLLIVLSFFGFSERVDAAQELMCLYEKESKSIDKVLLVQESNGSLYVLKNKDDVGLENGGWYKSSAVPRWGSVSLFGWNWDKNNDLKITSGSLKECPKQYDTISGGGVRFYNDGSHNVLKDSRNKVILPSMIYYETKSEVDSAYSKTSCSAISDKWITPYKEDGEYIQSCLYYKQSGLASSSCHIIQINVDKFYNVYLQQTYPFHVVSALHDRDSFDSDLTVDDLKNNYSGSCPVAIYVYNKVHEAGGQINMTYGYNIKVSLTTKDDYDEYVKMDAIGKNIINDSLSADGKVSLNFNKIKISNCRQLLGDNEELIGLLNAIINIIKFSVPIILVGFGSVDFCKAIFSGSEDDMKKSTKKFVKRVIIAMIIFLIPVILKFILGVANGIWDNISIDLCGIL